MQEVAVEGVVDLVNVCGHVGVQEQRHYAVGCLLGRRGFRGSCVVLCCRNVEVVGDET